MRITLVNTTDIVGGAERCSYELARALHGCGHEVALVVGRKLGHDPFVTQLQYTGWERRLRRFCFERLGLTDIVLRSPLAACSSHPQLCRADVYNLHNMHGGYWNFWTLPMLARRAPVVLTLHDEWLLTGDCTYAYDCLRWLAGCGACPQARWPDPADRYAIGGADLTRINAWLKQKCLRALPPERVTVVAPSQWLLARVGQLPALARFPRRQIEHGVDLETFRPLGDPACARGEFGLPRDRFLIFTAASDLNHARKNFQMILELTRSSGWPEKCLLVCAGRLNPQDEAALAGLPVRCLGYLNDPARLARALGACDIALLAPLADNFPYAALEALACGSPVLATAVGGLPEIVDDGVTGWLLPQPPTIWDLAQAMRRVVETPACKLRSMQLEARSRAKQRFSLPLFRDRYMNLFQECATQARQ